MAVERITTIAGRAVPLRGDNIDTDRIIPARFLKAITFDGLERHLFEDDRREAEAASRPHPLSDRRYAGASILLVNANFGCGSSREHAPQAIQRHGIRAIVGQSFSEIFFGNALALGLPCITASADTMETVMRLVETQPPATIEIDLADLRLRVGGDTHDVSLPPAARDALRDGSWDATGLLLENFDEVRAVASRLPYLG